MNKKKLSEENEEPPVFEDEPEDEDIYEDEMKGGDYGK